MSIVCKTVLPALTVCAVCCVTGGGTRGRSRTDVAGCGCELLCVVGWVVMWCVRGVWRVAGVAGAAMASRVARGVYTDPSHTTCCCVDN